MYSWYSSYLKYIWEFQVTFPYWLNTCAFTSLTQPQRHLTYLIHHTHIPFHLLIIVHCKSEQHSLFKILGRFLTERVEEICRITVLSFVMLILVVSLVASILGTLLRTCALLIHVILKLLTDSDVVGRLWLFSSGILSCLIYF